MSTAQTGCLACRPGRNSSTTVVTMYNTLLKQSTVSPPTPYSVVPSFGGKGAGPLPVDRGSLLSHNPPVPPSPRHYLIARDPARSGPTQRAHASGSEGSNRKKDSVASVSDPEVAAHGPLLCRVFSAPVPQASFLFQPLPPAFPEANPPILFPPGTQRPRFGTEPGVEKPHESRSTFGHDMPAVPGLCFARCEV